MPDNLIRATILLTLVVPVAKVAQGATWIDARSDIFDSGDTASSRDGMLPVSIQLPGEPDKYRVVEFSSVLGSTKAGAAWPEVEPDGGSMAFGGTVGTNILSADGISGIKHDRFLFLSAHSSVIKLHQKRQHRLAWISRKPVTTLQNSHPSSARVSS